MKTNSVGSTFLLVFAVCALLTAMVAVPALAANSRFLIIASHTKESCLKSLDEANAMHGFLSKVDWGCMSGDHTGYVILEAKDEAAVRKMIPASWSDAKIVKLNKFTAKQIESFHKNVK